MPPPPDLRVVPAVGQDVRVQQQVRRQSGGVEIWVDRLAAGHVYLCGADAVEVGPAGEVFVKAQEEEPRRVGRGDGDGSLGE
jgi:hypothetical protein